MNLNRCQFANLPLFEFTRKLPTLMTELFASGQAYVALSRVRLLNGLHLDELDCRQLTYENTANTEMEKLQT
jgi:hypothetical protein